MLKLYIDDSGTDARSPVCGVGALIGTTSQWTEFDDVWKRLLAAPIEGKPRLKAWSTFDNRWGLNEFESYNQAERDHVTYRFREVITKSGVHSMANMIDRIAWDEIMVARFGDKIASIEGMALFALIDRLRPWVARHPEGPTMAVYYDKGRENNSEIGRIARLLGAAMTSLPQIASFSFLRVAEATPLQGADMIATESFWFAQDFLRGVTEPTRPHYRAYLRDNWERGNGMILDREGIEANAARRNPDGTVKRDEPGFSKWAAGLSSSFDRQSS